MNISRIDSAICVGIKQYVGTCPSCRPAALNIGASMDRRVGTDRSRAVSETKSEEARATKFCLLELLSQALACLSRAFPNHRPYVSPLSPGLVL